MEIDVSKCAFYNNGKCDNPNGMACNCCNNVDCYYKQLQQLMQENEELKEKLKQINAETFNKCFTNEVYINLRQEIDKLKLENEDLKSEIRQKKMTIMMNNDHYHNVDIQNRKYSQCLDEIFENIEYIEATAERMDDDNYIALACRIAETSKNILQLIKQAKEGN